MYQVHQETKSLGIQLLVPRYHSVTQHGSQPTVSAPIHYGPHSSWAELLPHKLATQSSQQPILTSCNTKTGGRSCGFILLCLRHNYVSAILKHETLTLSFYMWCS